MKNSEIASIFYELADLLEIKGENPFKIRAYRSAANTIETMSDSIEELVKKNYDLTELPHIGKEIAKKIKEIVNTGKLSKLEELKKQIPPSLEELLAIEGLGPKRVKVLYEELNITNLEQLKEAALNNKIASLKGFGKKIQEKILKGIKLLKQEGVRFLYAKVEPYANALLKYLKSAPAIENIEIAGSFRRRKESVGDLDILVTAKSAIDVVDYFIKYKEISKVLSAGTLKSTVILKNSLQVDLRVLPISSFGAGLHYFTGSKSHVIKLREMAVNMGLKVNEYGVFKDSKLIASTSEEEVYRAFNLSYIEPELRENRGEIEASLKNSLPKLITMQDIKGDLHIKADIDDIKEFVKASIQRGYSYIAIVADSKNANSYFKRIDTLNRTFKNFKILKSVEVEILKDGSLDANEDILKQADIVHIFMNSYFNLDKSKQTKRLIKAIKNPFVDILAHPTCRILGKREPISFDFRELTKVAKESGVSFEIDARANRADLPDFMIKEAKERGVKFSISSVASTIEELSVIKYGLFQARRGWLEARDVINTSLFSLA